MNRIGIMQGRLSPMQNGRIQAFPKKNWKEEFCSAKECGFELIEWVFDYVDFRDNPLLQPKGLETIKNLSEETGVEIKSVCANYFTDNPFWAGRVRHRQESLEVLKRLLAPCQEIGVECIVLPMLEKADISACVEDIEFKQALIQGASSAESHQIFLSIETTLEAIRLMNLLESLGNSCLNINYDIGNSTGLNRNVSEEIELLNPWIKGVHIKDKKRFGESKPLGEGDADFTQIFKKLTKNSYSGHYILETPRGDNPIRSAQKNLRFVKERLAKTLDRKAAEWR